MTSREDSGRIVSDRHPWEPVTSESGDIWYRVSDEVAAEFSADDAPRAAFR